MDTATGVVVRESAAADDPTIFAVIFLREGAGNTRQNNVYTEEALRALVREIRAHPFVWWNHAPVEAIQRGDERLLGDMAGAVIKESAHYDAALRAVVGTIKASPKAAEAIGLAHSVGHSVGVSIEAMGRRATAMSDRIVGWANYRGACLVPKGGAGGMTLGVVREAEGILAREFADAGFTPTQRACVIEAAVARADGVGGPGPAVYATVREAAAELVATLGGDRAIIRAAEPRLTEAQARYVLREAERDMRRFNAHPRRARNHRP